jgi:hypothetical protein
LALASVTFVAAVAFVEALSIFGVTVNGSLRFRKRFNLLCADMPCERLDQQQPQYTAELYASSAAAKETLSVVGVVLHASFT